MRWPEQRLCESERLPTGYRVAWYDFVRREVVAFPFGLHWLAWLVRRIWQCTFWWRPTALDRLLRDHEANVTRQHFLEWDAQRESDERLAVQQALGRVMGELFPDVGVRSWMSEDDAVRMIHAYLKRRGLALRSELAEATRGTEETGQKVGDRPPNIIGL